MIFDIIKDLAQPFDIANQYGKGLSNLYGKDKSFGKRVQGIGQIATSGIRSIPYLITGGKVFSTLAPTVANPTAAKLYGGLGKLMTGSGTVMAKSLVKLGFGSAKTAIHGAKSVRSVLPMSKLPSISIKGVAKASAPLAAGYGAAAVLYKNADLIEDVIQYRRGNPAPFRKEMKAYRHPISYIKDMFLFKDGPAINVRGLDGKIKYRFNQSESKLIPKGGN